MASVRPVQSTPIPMMPRHVPLGSMGAASVSNPAINFPINYLQRAGVLVQKIVTTTGQLLWQLHCSLPFLGNEIAPKMNREFFFQEHIEVSSLITECYVDPSLLCFK